jgi:hypothetical protein
MSTHEIPNPTSNPKHLYFYTISISDSSLGQELMNKVEPSGGSTHVYFRR